MRRIAFALLALVATATAQAEDETATKEKDITSFIKVTRNDSGEPTALYTPVIRYTLPKDDGSKVVLDIVGAVHVADPAYYQMLNLHFQNYEVVLYELVAPDNKLVPEAGQPNTVADLAKLFLQLEHQLKGIDYKAKNFVHADFTHSEMKEAMAKNGDNAFTIAASLLIEMVRQQNKAAYEAEKMQKKDGFAPKQPEMPKIDLMALLTGDQNQAVKIKRMMADSMEKQGANTGFGSTIGTYLIDKRNDDALGTLDLCVEGGKTALCLFYGAAHIPDFDKKLRKRGYTRGETRWVPAWNKLELVENQTQDVRNLLRILDQLNKK